MACRALRCTTLRHCERTSRRGFSTKASSAQTTRVVGHAPARPIRIFDVHLSGFNGLCDVCFQSLGHQQAHKHTSHRGFPMQPSSNTETVITPKEQNGHCTKRTLSDLELASKTYHVRASKLPSITKRELQLSTQQSNLRSSSQEGHTP